MKITILQGAFLPVPPDQGGAIEKRWFAVGKEFSKLGHEVIHISKLYKSFPQSEVIEGVVHRRVKGYNTPSSGIYLKFLDLLYSIRAIKKIDKDSDIIITNTFWSPLLLSRSLKKKCVVDVARMPKGQIKFYSEVARLRANSSPVAEAIRKEIDSENHRKVIMIPNSIPFKTEEDLANILKERIILYVGRIHPEKGIDLLIKGFNQLKTDWVLKIVGPWASESGGGGEAYKNELKVIANNNENIKFEGPVFGIDNLNAYYKEATIFVYPSIAENGETFGLAPLEAMAWGCVPIVSSLACFRDFISHDKNGFIFDYKDPNVINKLAGEILRLQDDARLTKKLSAAALEVRESHSTASVSNKFITLFEDIVQENIIKNNESI